MLDSCPLLFVFEMPLSWASGLCGVCVCVITGIELHRSRYGTCYYFSYSVQLHIRHICSEEHSIRVCCVCVCDACLYLNVYLCLGECLCPCCNIMIFYITINAIMYLHCHYKCYYILALSL